MNKVDHDIIKMYHDVLKIITKYDNSIRDVKALKANCHYNINLIKDDLLEYMKREDTPADILNMYQHIIEIERELKFRVIN